MIAIVLVRNPKMKVLFALWVDVINYVYKYIKNKVPKVSSDLELILTTWIIFCLFSNKCSLHAKQLVLQYAFQRSKQ